MNFKFFKPLSIAILMIGMGQAALAMENPANLALHTAVYEGDPAKVQAALINHANINYANEYGYTALHIAALSNCLELPKILLDQGPDVNCTNSNGDTPLHRACWSNCPQYVKLLLEHGADINCTNKNGKTALDEAKEGLGIWDRGSLKIITGLITEAAKRRERQEFNALCNKRILEQQHANRSITIKGQEFKLHEAFLSARCLGFCLELNPTYKNEAC